MQEQARHATDRGRTEALRRRTEPVQSAPSPFSIQMSAADRETYQLAASQVLPLPRERAFSFFEDPRSLCEITPDWLDFRMLDARGSAEVFEGAEFDYRIRWFGLRIAWRSRIVEYQPPDRFVDIQLIGPYRSWRHLHTFIEVPEGTLMRDTVTYRLPLGPIGRAVHRLGVRKQLNDIFTYRARRIDEWARGVLQSTCGR